MTASRLAIVGEPRRARRRRQADRVDVVLQRQRHTIERPRGSVRHTPTIRLPRGFANAVRLDGYECVEMLVGYNAREQRVR